MKKYYFDWDLSGYGTHQIQHLKRELKELGFEETNPEKGGAGETGRQILLWVSLHYQDILVALASNTVYELLKTTVNRIYRWYKQSKPMKKLRPAIVVHINFHKESKVQSVILFVDRNYSTEELKGLLSREQKHDIGKSESRSTSSRLRK